MTKSAEQQDFQPLKNGVQSTQRALNNGFVKPTKALLKNPRQQLSRTLQKGQRVVNSVANSEFGRSTGAL